MMWTALILSYFLASTGKYASKDAPGAEVRIYESLGPQGPTKEECERNANARRPGAAKELKLNSPMQLKYECVQMPLAVK